MADPHVISALREKRALVAGLIEKLERKLEQHRADLTHIDGVLRLFQPDRDPAEITPRHTHARPTGSLAKTIGATPPGAESLKMNREKIELAIERLEKLADGLKEFQSLGDN